MAKTQNESIEKKVRVAIIGASYAGLTIGNVLHQHSIPFTIFESSPNYYNNINDGDDDDSCSSSSSSSSSSNSDATNKFNNNTMKQNLFVIGPFILPCFENILSSVLKLKYLGKSDNETNTNDMEHCYERCNVILSLLKNIQKNIRFDTSIQSITKYQRNHREIFSCVSQGGIKYEPFQYIIAADGVHSVIGSNHQMDDDHKVLLIGDARWVNDSWYNFGFQRVREGGDIAIRDGVELGINLVKIIKHEKDTHKESKETMDIIGKYSAREKYLLRKKMRYFRRIAVVLFLAFLFEKFKSCND